MSNNDRHAQASFSGILGYSTVTSNEARKQSEDIGIDETRVNASFDEVTMEGSFMNFSTGFKSS